MTLLSRALQFAILNPYSDFYRRKYGSDYKTYIEKDLAGIPLLTREEIDATPFFDRIFIPKEMIHFVRATSGSSGRGVIAFPLAEEPELMRYRKSLGFSGEEALAGRFFGPYFKKEDTYSILIYSPSNAVHETYVVEEGGHVAVSGDYRDQEKTFARAEAAGVDSMYSFPSPLAGVGHYVAGTPLAARMKRIVLMGERVTEPLRRELVEAFPHATIAAVYATVDAHGTVGYTCPSYLTVSPNYMHVFPTYQLELVDPETGHVVPQVEGAEGEVVITALTPMAFSLVRYRTGDYAVVRKHGLCSCGSTEPMFEILGRVGLDRIKLLPYGGLSSAVLEEAVLKLPYKVADFTAVWNERISPPGLSTVLYTDHAPYIHSDMLARAIQVSSTRTYADLVELGVVSPLVCTAEPVEVLRTLPTDKRKRLQVSR
ncbi:MAG: hypothetical protein NT019_00450 [Candidatus Adlerbacteria bacterium]|nr:hypothetical protein [Candidatus Adlerbacteria bacterium]